MAIDDVPPDLDGAGMRIGIVQSRFNEWAGQALAEACIGELLVLGVDEDDITRVTVPGALEIPLTLARMPRETARQRSSTSCVPVHEWIVSIDALMIFSGPK